MYEYAEPVYRKCGSPVDSLCGANLSLTMYAGQSQQCVQGKAVPVCQCVQGKTATAYVGPGCRSVCGTMLPQWISLVYDWSSSAAFIDKEFLYKHQVIDSSAVQGYHLVYIYIYIV